MALIRLDFVAETTRVNLPVYMVVPGPGSMGDLPVRKRKVLYLLHGLSDDGSAWQRYTSIETIARETGLVVVMPSVGRSFYIDQRNGQKYFSYLMDELPRYLSDVFALSPEREDTLIAGNSMGGYGAFKAALLYPERFAAAASFSGVLSMAMIEANPEDPRYPEFTALMGNLDEVVGSVHDPEVWLRNAAENPGTLPKLYVSCGRQDDLLPLNRNFKALCETLGVKLDYHEEDGIHDWNFWDQQIREFLKVALS